MDSGAWRAIICSVTRVGQDLTTKLQLPVVCVLISDS